MRAQTFIYYCAAGVLFIAAIIALCKDLGGLGAGCFAAAVVFAVILPGRERKPKKSKVKTMEWKK